jgi:DNA primase
VSDQVDEVRSRIDIVELVGQTVPLKRAGKNWKGLCPFHQDRNPSFYVNDQTGYYKCWSCNESGDIFTWVMKTQNVDFREALEILAQRAGVKLEKRSPKDEGLRSAQIRTMAEALSFFQSELQKSTAAREYCERRGIGPEVIDRWELGYAPDVGEALASHLRRKGFRLADCQALFLVEDDGTGGFYDKFRGRLIFPIRNERGDLVAFGGRVLGDGIPKYINSGDTPLYRKSRVLYGMQHAKEPMRAGEPAVLVEGYLDVIACHAAGVESAVASLGTSLSEEHAKLLARWTDRVHILYDSDAAGEKAAARAAEVLGQEGLKVKVALMPKGEDPDTLLRTAGADAVRKAANQGLTPLEYRLRSIEQRFQPSDEDYWREAVAALAAASSEMERTHFIHKLAPQYPDLRDPIEARKALTRMVQAERRRTAPTAAGAASAPRAVAQDRPPRATMKSAEATLFRAILDRDLRRTAWEALQEPDLFLTGTATDLAAALVEAFPEGAPEGAPAEWLHRVDEAHRERLIEFSLSETQISDEFLDDTLSLLRRKREERSLAELKQHTGDDRLAQIQAHLRKLKGE